MKEVTYEEWQKNPKPRMMWVWNSNVEDKLKRMVLFLTERNPSHPVVALTSDNITVANYKHCAEIEEPKYHRMTSQELSWWLMDGIKEGKHREWKHRNGDYIYSTLEYIEREQGDIIIHDIVVRENGGEWHEPLLWS